MSRDEILKKLSSIITNDLELEIPEDFNESLNLFDDLGINSIFLMQLVVHLEKDFDIGISEDEITENNIVTIGDLIDLILKLQK